MQCLVQSTLLWHKIVSLVSSHMSSDTVLKQIPSDPRKTKQLHSVQVSS